MSIVGTAISTTTDGYGDFLLSGVDSGIHVLQIAKTGFETRQLSNVFCNGADSTKVVFKSVDTLGHEHTYGEIPVTELPPNFQLEGIQSKINAISTTPILSCDWLARISMSLDSDYPSTVDSMDMGFMMKLTSDSVLNSAQMPTVFYNGNPDLANGWIGYYGTSKSVSKPYTGNRVFTIGDSTGIDPDYRITISNLCKMSGVDLVENVQMYLHISPVCKKPSLPIETWTQTVV